MDFNEEFIKEHDLTEEQVAAINNEISTYVAEEKKAWDGKANADAERILEGAVGEVVNVTGITREKGQHAADYIKSAASTFLDTKLAEKEAELARKMEEIENSDANATLKKEYNTLKEQLDELQKKEADFNKLIEGNYEAKYTELFEKYSTSKINGAFSGVKPNFPDTVNKYESKAIWDEFVNSVKDTYEIDFNDNGEAVAIDKTNKHMIHKLSDLVAKNEAIQTLAKGRQQKGLGFKKGNDDVDGVPFKVNLNATSSEQQQQVRDYLKGTLKLDPVSKEWSAKFAEYYGKIKQKTAS